MTGEDVDALYLHHIVRAAQNDVDARIGTPAGAVARQRAGKVMRAVTNQRRALLAKRGDYQLAHLSVGQDLAGFGIHNFKEHIVVPHVHAAVVIAADADARPVNLG